MPTVPKTVHGFYYTQKEDGLYGLELPPVCRDILAQASKVGFRRLSDEDYWLKLGRYMMTHCPQGYAGWDGHSHWIVYCGENIHNPKQNQGIQLLRFSSDGKMGYLWLDAADYKSFRDPDLEDDNGLGSGLYRLAYTPWDWLLSGDGDDDMFPLSNALKKAIEANTSWTNPLHQKMAKKYPPEKYWA